MKETLNLKLNVKVISRTATVVIISCMFATYYLVELDSELLPLDAKKAIAVFFFTIMMVSLMVYYYVNSREEDNSTNTSFSDVDAKRREREANPEMAQVLKELKELKNSQESINYEKIEGLVRKSEEIKVQERKQRYESFESYFESLTHTLEEQAQTADEKASKLLDKGVAYSRGGIVFFIISIFAWQLIAYIKDFETQHIYGIASCSVLFVFIEFLAAWFLKQYRHYVDTSTYLLKIKSIFDRYMLTYLVLSESDEADYSALTRLLSDDIKWPETYLMKNPDILFAKDAMDTMTLFAKSMKSEAKNAGSKA